MDTLRSYEGFLASLRCYDWLPAVVSGASDVDCMLERRGRLLFLEAKPREGPKVHVPAGQFYALRSLASKEDVSVWLVAEDDKAKVDKELPRYSRLILDGKTKPHAEGYRNGQRQAVFYTDGRFDSCTLQQLQGFIHSWWVSCG